MKRIICALIALLTMTVYGFAARNFYQVEITNVGIKTLEVIRAVNYLTNWGLKVSKDSVNNICSSHPLIVLEHQYKADAVAAVDTLTRAGATAYIYQEKPDPLSNIDNNTGIYSIKLKSAGSNKTAVQEAICDILSPDCAPTDEIHLQAQSMMSSSGWLFQNISTKSANCILNYLTSAGAEAEKVETFIPYCGPSVNDDGTKLSGAYYTGNYTSPFKMYLGKTDEEIQEKLNSLWNHYFKGDNNSKVYYETSDGAYIMDVNNNDVRSEGMGYGMMVCVQTNHQEEFDKLWNWAKNHMWHKSGESDGYFSWQCNTDGSVRDQGCCPDGDMYITMALLFAANRWNDSAYMEDAQYILNRMWHNSYKMFSEQSYIITFQPSAGYDTWTDPSYSLPAFVDLFSRWSRTDKDKWSKATTATRGYLYKASNTTSGLFSDYANFDGTPHAVDFNNQATKYMYDAMRCAMNFGMDYYLFGADNARQSEMAKRIIDFFEKDGYKHARFNWDGSSPSESYTIGEAGCNAVACYALIGNKSYDDAIRKNLQIAWDAKPMTGQYRYYDGMVHYLAMLHLCGSFKIWKPATDAEAMRSLYLGDANGDGSVTMADANVVVNYYLAEDKSTVKDFVFHFADANEDGEISMADANQIVNIFLSR